jgi:hypothetical protein
MLAIFLVFVAACAAVAGEDMDGLYTALLADHVDGARVDYASLCEDPRLAEVVEWMSSVDPEAIEDDAERFAFWINAYNAFTLKIVCDNYPLESINDLHFGGLVVGTVLNKTVWDKKFIMINGEDMSLNQIEHDILRKEFKDPRLHFAIVCASRSCPALRAEAFVGGRLESQLDEQARTFFADPGRNVFDVENKKARLSKILDWFSDDFGENDEEILVYVSRFLPAAVAAAIRTDLDEWDVEHLEWDWSLND